MGPEMDKQPSVGAETVPLMICRSSRLITTHLSVYAPLSPFSSSTPPFNLSANGIKKHVARGLCNLENKSIKFINLIIGNNNE